MADGVAAIRYIGEKRPITASLVMPDGNTIVLMSATVVLRYQDNLLPVQYPVSFATPITATIAIAGPSQIVTASYLLDLTIAGWVCGNYVASFVMTDATGAEYNVDVDVVIAQS